MNRWLIGPAVLLAGCVAQSEPVTLALGDAEDYQDFLEYQGEETDPVPFEAEPLFVDAIGKVRAQPDIAVITATISATDVNESKAIEEMGGIINDVQQALSDREIETGFTAIRSEREFDEACQNENNFAWRRHREIVQDYNFNKNLDRRGDTETKRRAPKPRVAQQVCRAQEIRVSTNMVIRVQPADVAGDVLRALSDAGAERSLLYGYDFTDYDALYQTAATKAVEQAREKAETVARLAGGSLGNIESFSVSPPERTSRFGPQPNVIRPANRYRGQSGSVVDRHMEREQDYSPPPPPAPMMQNWDGSMDEIVVTATRKSSGFATVATPISVADIANQGTVTQEASTVIMGGQEIVSPGSSNALSISLLSGPQTISVAARLGYSYPTPLDGKIIINPETDN